MKPYYETPLGKLYHGDCLEIMPHLPPVDLVLTDPPYGINHPCNFHERGRGALAPSHDYATVYGDDKPFDPSHLLKFKNVCLWGGNYFSDKLPPASGWVVWDKRVQDGKGVNDQSDAELAWTNFVKGVRVFRHMWNGFWRDSERGESYHPTQKPVALVHWLLCLKWTPAGILLDPYLGCGPTAIACERLNRQWIGIEIEEKYCEIAAKRIELETKQMKLFS